LYSAESFQIMGAKSFWGSLRFGKRAYAGKKNRSKESDYSEGTKQLESSPKNFKEDWVGEWQPKVAIGEFFSELPQSRSIDVRS
jgi:hypothetical protein